MRPARLFPVPVVLALLMIVARPCCGGGAADDQSCDCRATPPPTSRRHDRSLKIGVIIPSEDRHPFSIPRAGPGISYALESVNRRMHLLQPVTNLSAVWRDSHCSDALGPLAAFDLHENESVDAFIGPACDYALAPIARFAAVWNKPVITGGALVRAFVDKSEFALLTRISGSYDKLGEAVGKLFLTYNWTVAALMYNKNLGPRQGLGKTKEWFIMEGIYVYLVKPFKSKYPRETMLARDFDENGTSDYFDIEDLLNDASKEARS